MIRAIRAFAFISSVATILILTVPKPAFARPCCDDFWRFYSDCTFTEVIGDTYHDCAGQMHRTGTENFAGPHYYESNSCNNDSCCPEGPPCDYYCEPSSIWYCP